MAAEQQSGAENSFSCSAFCERLSRAQGADLVYAGDPCGRAPLEILWLKLSLLADVIRVAKLPKFDPNTCVVTLDPAAKHIPLAWTFRVACDPTSVTTSISNGSSDLGLFWLGALLVNSQQDAARIQSAATELVTACGPDADRLVKAIFSSPVFSARQLTMSAAGEANSAVPAGLWRDVVLMGFKLATRIPKFSYTAEAEDFSDGVYARLLADCMALQARARQALFIDPPQMEKNLRDVLLELIGDPHWLDTLTAKPAVSATPERARPVIESPPPPASVPVAEEENAEATIIIKRGAHPPATPSRAPTSTPTPVAGGATPGVARPVAPPPPPAEPENLEATIIISKDKKR